MTTPRRTSVANAVTTAVRALSTRPEDKALVQLALRYADALDDSLGVLAGVADELTAIRSDMKEADETLRQRVTRCEQAVEAQRVLEAIGPKLLAVLTSLGATPAARADAVKGVVVSGSTELQLARDRAAKRTAAGAH